VGNRGLSEWAVRCAPRTGSACMFSGVRLSHSQARTGVRFHRCAPPLLVTRHSQLKFARVRLLNIWNDPPALCLQFVYIGVMAAETTTVRVRRLDSERLQTLARARQTAVVDVVHAAIDALERQEFLRGLNGDYQRLRSEPELWEKYLAERHQWDALA